MIWGAVGLAACAGGDTGKSDKEKQSHGPQNTLKGQERKTRKRRDRALCHPQQPWAPAEPTSEAPAFAHHEDFTSTSQRKGDFN